MKTPASKNIRKKDNHVSENRIIKRGNRLLKKISQSYNKRNRVVKMDDFPPEILLKIFSYLPQKDIYRNVRLVCTRWYFLSLNSKLWERIKVDASIPSATLGNWLETSPKLRYLEIESRRDAAFFLKKIIKYNRNIEELKIHKCWASHRQIYLPSQPLCSLILRLPYLKIISLQGCRFLSCKFFRLIATRDQLLEGMRKIPKNNRPKSATISFFGSASIKQLRVFLKARRDANKSKLAMLRIEHTPRSLADVASHHQEIIATDDEEIEHILEALNI